MFLTLAAKNLFGISAVILTTLVIVYNYFFSYWKKRGLNYVKPHMPFGNAHKACFGNECLGEFFQDMYLKMRNKSWKHGGVYFFGKPIYMPLHTDVIKKVLINDFLHFPNRGFFASERSDVLSTHIINMENYRWKNIRAKLPAAFTAAKMRTYVAIMERVGKILIEKLDEFALTRKSVDIKEVLNRFGTDIITSCAFGMESNTLNNENETLMEQGRVFFDYQWSRTKNSLVLLVPRHILTMFKFKIFTKSATNYFMNMFKNIKEHREREKIKRNDLTDLLMDLCDETKIHPDFNGKGKMEPLTFNEFASQMYVFFEAGFETSSSTQTFAMYELGVNPEVQDKLRREINTVLARHDGRITYNSVNEMEYLDRVVDETLRKYPIIPFLPRLCAKDYPVPGTDVTVEKGTFVVISNLGIHYDPEYYPDPNRFDPDRFTTENKGTRPFGSYLPFGEGPRICIGKRFGLWQTKIGLVSMVKNYRITLSNKMQLPFSFDTPGLILKAKGDVWVDLERI